MKRMISGAFLMLVVMLAVIPSITAKAYYEEEIVVAYEKDGYASVSRSSLDRYSLFVGETSKYITVSNSEDGMEWIWSSSNGGVAQVAPEGLVTPVGKGTVRFTGTCRFEGKKYTIKLKLYVKKPKLTVKQVILAKGQEISAKVVRGLDETGFETENGKIATVSEDGIITAKNTGSTAVKIKAEDGKIYRLKVKVKNVSKDGYNDALKDAEGNPILRFNAPDEALMHGKIIKKSNKYLKRISEDYCYAETEDGSFIALILTKEPLPELAEIYGKTAEITGKTRLGYLGKMKGIEKVLLTDTVDSVYPNLQTGQGAFYNVFVSYVFQSPELDSESYIPMAVMCKNGYYITLYGWINGTSDYDEMTGYLFGQP